MLQHAHCCLNQHTAEGSCVSHCSQPVCATDSSIISYSSLPSPSTPPLPHLLSFSSLSHLLFCPSPSSPLPLPLLPLPLLPLPLPPLLFFLPSFTPSLFIFLLFSSPSCFLFSLLFLPLSPLHPLSLTSQLSLCSPQMPQEVLMSAFSFEIN